ncbi:MAG: type I-C CRISPR-associated protein Cas8c/Csd1 [Provencibacterium sp.]|jgi:CRISPR-associated protein Csd1|nr:type I-C CRISPR-associated protein Cas8c/Csd1 [Provencibacterium sp.]
MLQELYRYALDHQLAARPGFKLKTPKAYVCLNRQGKLTAIDPPPPQPVPCPDLGYAAQSTTKCNFPVEKMLITLTQEKPQKRTFFLQTLKEAAETEPLFGVLYTALTSPETVEAIGEALQAHRVKPADIIGYKVDGRALESLPGYQSWWRDYAAAQQSTFKKQQIERCLITGEIVTPIRTVPKVSGLLSVGGQQNGDTLICFDKDAFCSYGRKHAANAPVSEEAMRAVNVALEELINVQKAPILAGARWLHWYKSALPQELPDPLGELFGFQEEDEEESAREQGDEADPLLTAAARQQADALLKSPYTGEMPAGMQDNEYYILSLSGAGGRMMVRGWQQGRFIQLQQALERWWEELSLISPGGKGPLPQPRLGQLNARLIKPQKGKSLSEQMSKELASLEPQLIFAIIGGSPLPAQAAARALQSIRSKMMSGDGEKREPMPDARACQLLKVWLSRQNAAEKGGVKMKAELTPDYPNAAYHCGRMMAVYAAIQSSAMGDVGAGVLQRYYTAASCTPALVFGRLSGLCQHHLAKLDNPGLARYYEKLLGEIAQKIAPPLPAALDLRGQAEFSLGYYQQRAALFAPHKGGESSKKSGEADAPEDSPDEKASL